MDGWNGIIWDHVGRGRDDILCFVEMGRGVGRLLIGEGVFWRGVWKGDGGLGFGLDGGIWWRGFVIGHCCGILTLVE